MLLITFSQFATMVRCISVTLRVSVGEFLQVATENKKRKMFFCPIYLVTVIVTFHIY